MQIYSFSPFGYEGSLVTVEVDLRRGIPAIDLVSLADGAVKEAEEREIILRKYIWVMAYHNQFCVSHQKDNYFINTICNCDKRFMKMVIFVNRGEPNTQENELSQVGNTENEL